MIGNWPQTSSSSSTSGLSASISSIAWSREGLDHIDRQAKRIATIREAAEQKGIPLFINARTDVFLGNGNDVDEALERSQAYASAGVSGFFVLGLTASDQI